MRQSIDSHLGLRPRAACVCMALVALCLGLAACGESSEEKANKTVCSARSEIKARIHTLEGLTPSLTSLPQVKTEVTAIAEDVKKIAGAQKDLNPTRRAQVQKATDTFEDQLRSLASSVTSTLDLTSIEPQLKAAFKQLESSYRQALEPIECG